MSMPKTADPDQWAAYNARILGMTEAELAAERAELEIESRGEHDVLAETIAVLTPSGHLVLQVTRALEILQKAVAPLLVALAATLLTVTASAGETKTQVPLSWQHLARDAKTVALMMAKLPNGAGGVLFKQTKDTYSYMIVLSDGHECETIALVSEELYLRCGTRSGYWVLQRNPRATETDLNWVESAPDVAPPGGRES